MKKLVLSLAMAIAAAGAAHAADLPTTKAPEKPNCWASLWTWLNSSPADCPFSYGPFTLYGTLDGGIGYESNGAGYNPWFNNGVSNIVTKQSTHGPQWLWTPNGLSQSVVGIKMSQDLAGLGLPGWSLVGDAETGFNPFGFYRAWAQRAVVENNGKSLFLQNANADSSRTGQWDNSQGFIGVSNKTWGTLVVGRVNTLSLDALNSYDPMAGAYAFSPFGYSGSYAGFGDTEAARANTAVKYRVEIQNYRLGALWQWGGYNQGNGTNGQYQAQIGGDFKIPDIGSLPTAGVLSLDAIGDYAKDVVNVGAFGTLTQCATLTRGPFKGQTGCSYDAGAPGTIPLGYANTDLQATLSDNIGVQLDAKYKWRQWTFYDGLILWRQSNPSGNYQNGFETIGFYNVPATIPGYNIPGTLANRRFPTQWVVNNAYNINRMVNVWYTGIRYDITPQFDVVGAFYILGQNNYNFTVNSRTGVTAPAPCTVAPTTGVKPNGAPFTIYRVSSGKCGGTTDFISALIDYRPVPRVDMYAGVMVSNVYGGLANGYYATQTINPTAGIRIKF